MTSALRRTKIVTTLGPSTDKGETLEAIIRAGANVVRMNFSHGSAEDHKARAQKVREIAAKLGKHVAILGDLQGPKIRVSTFKGAKLNLSKVNDLYWMPIWHQAKGIRMLSELITKICQKMCNVKTFCCWMMAAYNYWWLQSKAVKYTPPYWLVVRYQITKASTKRRRPVCRCADRKRQT